MWQLLDAWLYKTNTSKCASDEAARQGRFLSRFIINSVPTRDEDGLLPKRSPPILKVATERRKRAPAQHRTRRGINLTQFGARSASAMPQIE